MKRLSTLRYEIAKDLTPEPRPLPLEEKQLRDSILRNDGMCEYCGKNRASGCFGDHLYPIIMNKYPSEYCSDEWNQIPACSTCNASKSGRTWRDWFSSDYSNNPMKYLSPEEQQILLARFTRYDSEMQRFCQRKTVNESDFDELMEKVTTMFKEIDDAVRQKIP